MDPRRLRVTMLGKRENGPMITPLGYRGLGTIEAKLSPALHPPYSCRALTLALGHYSHAIVLNSWQGLWLAGRGEGFDS